MTWWALATLGLGGWLAPVWVVETYLIVGVASLARARGIGRPRRERRGLPRVPAAVPVRYSTEEGQVGIGTLVDITERGAGLLIPRVTLDAEQVWIQFLWFDDRVGTRGRIVHAYETRHGVRLGLELLPLHPQTRDLLARYVMPYGQSVPRATDEALPVQVQYGTATVWAVALGGGGGSLTLLVPERVAVGSRITVSAWGRATPTECRVVRGEALRIGPVSLCRIETRPVAPA
ncbi:MAG: PilZ domain-containing protein [Armatimonadota bacterium]|nr:PilZ domain-containing protein [Armatimonadota bacterium]